MKRSLLPPMVNRTLEKIMKKSTAKKTVKHIMHYDY